MKFEKHLKNCGLFATLFHSTNGDLFLGCGSNATTLLKCPEGFSPISAAKINPIPDHIDDYLIRSVDMIAPAELTSATLPKDGRAADIVRVFSDEHGLRSCGISNADFGLIEKRDRVLVYDTDFDNDGDDVPRPFRALVITDPSGLNVLGIIKSVD